MTDFLATNPLAISAAESPRFSFLNSCPTPAAMTLFNPISHTPISPKLIKTSRNDTVSAALSSKRNGSSGVPGPSRDYSFYKELDFEDRKAKDFGFERNPIGDDDDKESRKSESDLGEDDLVRVRGDLDGDDLKKDEQVEKLEGKLRVRRGKQIIRRSNLLAKQVISIRSALSLGFVSQLWVDTTSWMVLFVEVRPNLLSGDSEKFLLEDISQVGDVVLVQDESVIDNEFKMIGLETLGNHLAVKHLESSRCEVY